MISKKNNNKILLSVQAKIILVVVLLVSLVLGLYALVEVNRKKTLMDAELSNLADVAAKRLTENLRIPLWNLDSELVAGSIEAEMLAKDVEAIFVFDGKGEELVAASQRRSNWLAVAADKSQINGYSDRVKTETYINHKNEVIGRVVVFVTKKFRLDDLYRSISVLLFTLLFLDVAIFIVLFLVINRVLKKPIVELSDAANQISRGDFNVVIETDRGDEIGVVANSIDRLQVSLKMSIDRLRKLSHQNKALISKMEGRNG
ncbi:MAG: HAMP domain-containing protein [Cellvibrionaceae bacterium]